MTKLELVKAVIAKYRRDENEYDGDVVNADEWEDWDDDKECCGEPHRIEPGRHGYDLEDKVLFNSDGIIVWQREEEDYDGYTSYDDDICVNGLSKEDFKLLEDWNRSFTHSMYKLDERVRLIKEKRLKAFVSTEASGIEYLEKKEEEERERKRLEDERERRRIEEERRRRAEERQRAEEECRRRREEEEIQFWNHMKKIAEDNGFHVSSDELHAAWTCAMSETDSMDCPLRLKGNIGPLVDFFMDRFKKFKVATLYGMSRDDLYER